MPNRHAAHIDAIFGQILVKQRTRAGLDQATLANRLGLHQPALSRLERGESPTSISVLVKLATALGVRPSTLIEEFELALVKLKKEDIKVASKKELSKDKSSLALALLGGAAIAFLISR